VTRLILIVGLLSMSLAAVACGAGKEAGVVSSPTASAELTVVPSAPLAEPTIVGNEIVFPDKGYKALIPEGWTADANMLRQGRVTYDGFVDPEKIQGVQPNITVAREELQDKLDSSAYVDLKLKTISALVGADVTVSGSVEVAGQQSSFVDYAHKVPVAFDKRDVIFVDNDVGWTITLTTPGGQRDTFLPILNDFLASFQLLGAGGS